AVDALREDGTICPYLAASRTRCQKPGLAVVSVFLARETSHRAHHSAPQAEGLVDSRRQSSRSGSTSCTMGQHVLAKENRWRERREATQFSRHRWAISFAGCLTRKLPKRWRISSGWPRARRNLSMPAPAKKKNAITMTAWSSTA